MKRSRIDLEITVSFLCTRVQCPTNGDWGKLRRVLNYLKETKYDKRVIGSNNILKLEKWIDSFHTVHEDIMGHKGGCMSCGVGIIHIQASKQKLEKKSPRNQKWLQSVSMCLAKFTL